MSRIFLDTNFFIYLIEGTGSCATRAEYLLRAFSARSDEVLASVMTLGEVLVIPLRRADFTMAQRYRRIFRAGRITLLPFLESSAEAFARIRIDKKIKAPDAIHLATAGTAGCDLFLTNDERLAGVVVPGIHFITTFEKAPI